MSMNAEIQRMTEEVDAMLAAAKAIPHPADQFELTVAEFVAEVQREALLKEYEERSGILMDMMNERNMLNGAHGDY